MAQKTDRKDCVLLLLLILAAVGLRLFPLTFNSFSDPDYYYHLRQIGAVLENQGIPKIDPLSNLGRQYTYYPLFHLMGASIAALTGLNPLDAYMALSILAVVISVLSVFIASREFLDALGIDSKYAYTAALFAATIPVFIIRQTVFSRPDAFAPAIIALLLWSVLKRKPVAAAILGASCALLHPLTFLMAGGIVAFAVVVDYAACKTGKEDGLFISKKESIWEALRKGAGLPIVTYGIFGATAASYYLSFPLWMLSAKTTYLTATEMVSANPISFFHYFGVMAVFAMLGFAECAWDKKRTKAVGLFAAAVLSVLLIYAAQRNVSYAGPASAIMASAGIAYAAKKSRQYSTWVWVLVGISCAVSASLAATSFGPQYTDAQLSGFSYMGKMDKAPVMAIWDRGHAITYLSGQQVVVDGYFEFEPKLDEKVMDIGEVYLSKDEKLVSYLAGKYGARIIFFDNKTKSVYNGDQNAFSNAFENGSGIMDKVFDTGDAQVFKIRNSSG